MPVKKQGQVFTLFFALADQLGITSDRELADLAGVSVESIANWRSGSVGELKNQTLQGAVRGLITRVSMLQERARAQRDAFESGLCGIEVEEGSDPATIQKKFSDRVIYDYLGHRFLYFDAQGSLAWERLIKTGYDQDRWLRGVAACADQWLSRAKDRHGRPKGVLARALGMDRKSRARGLDVVSLGPGEGGKELLLLRKVLGLEEDLGSRLPWLSLSLVDVSIPLLLEAARSARGLVGAAAPHMSVLPVCGDFEEGGLRFVQRLPTARKNGEEGVRLVLMLGNTFGNLRNEEAFIRNKLWKMTRPGDFVWLEVGLRPQRIEDDPLFRLTEADHEVTAAETCRRRLLIGPYRRWEAAAGRVRSNLQLRVSLREDDDSCPVPESVNFCHDLVIVDEQRACTMLYSRRYTLEATTRWFEELDFRVEGIHRVEDSKRRPRVAHLLLRRR
ncbi:MAG: L-histidine N(alpha)-methyltransferase [Myxococcota bacterium]